MSVQIQQLHHIKGFVSVPKTTYWYLVILTLSFNMAAWVLVIRLACMIMLSCHLLPACVFGWNWYGKFFTLFEFSTPQTTFLHCWNNCYFSLSPWDSIRTFFIIKEILLCYLLYFYCNKSSWFNLWTKTGLDSYSVDFPAVTLKNDRLKKASSDKETNT